MAMFTKTDWTTIDELEKELLSFAHHTAEDDKIDQIRRSWLVKDVDGLLFQLEKEEKNPSVYNWLRIERRNYNQAWLSRDPEIRVHTDYGQTSQPLGSFISLKGKPSYEGDPCQWQYEFRTNDCNYQRIVDVICQNPIVQPFQGSVVIPVRLFKITYEEGKQEVTYEVRNADNGNRVWVDVQFTSKEDAQGFNMREEYLPFLGNEITGLPGDSMKAYWYRTRLRPYQMP